MKKKHELMKYAYDNYPANTLCSWGQKEYSVNGKYEIGISQFGYLEIVDSNNSIVYNMGEFVPIVQKMDKVILISEDNLPLKVGDTCYIAKKDFICVKWQLCKTEHELSFQVRDDGFFINGDSKRIFSNIENAQNWIDTQNQQYEYVSLNFNGHIITIDRNGFTTGGLNNFTSKQLVHIYDTYKSIRDDYNFRSPTCTSVRDTNITMAKFKEGYPEKYLNDIKP